jgi:hypothetical protein
VSRSGTACGSSRPAWIAAIHVGLGFVTNTALMKRPARAAARHALPEAADRHPAADPRADRRRFVVAGVWHQDLGGLLTAIGVSSIVLGLALQNTLDNVMAGIAVLFERPFEVGDWVTVGRSPAR